MTLTLTLTPTLALILTLTLTLTRYGGYSTGGFGGYGTWGASAGSGGLRFGSAAERAVARSDVVAASPLGQMTGDGRMRF